MWSSFPPPNPASIGDVSSVLDPVLMPLGFAAGQGGASGQTGQVIFCRGDIVAADGGCIDLVVELEAIPDWHVTDVRYWGFTSDRWHLAFEPDADLATQLAHLARTLAATLADGE